MRNSFVLFAILGFAPAMIVLALDTSSALGSVAVTVGAEIRSEVSVAAAGRHGEVLLSNVDLALRAADLTLQEVELFAVGIGPGSFTGLRIGLATAKGLAMATDRPIVGVPSLEILASGLLGAGRTVIPWIDAHKGQVFAAAYRGQAGELPRAVVAPFFDKPKAAVARFEEGLVCGDGIEKYRSVLERSPLEIAPPPRCHPRAAELAHLAGLRFLDAGPSDLGALEPAYLRGSDAKLPEPR